MNLRTLALAAAVLVALAPAAQALYVVTPLRLHSETMQADVGDEVRFDVSPENESMQAQWGGQTVVVWYTFDPNESEDPEQPRAETEPSFRRAQILPDLQLDADASGTFTWTVPAEVDDRNVAVRVESADGELLAIRDLAVGDAPAVMRIAAGGPGEPVETPMETAPADEDHGPERERDTPGLGVVAALGMLGLAALAVRRRS